MPASILPNYSGNIETFIRLNEVASKLFRANPRNKNKHSMDISSDDVLQLLKSLNQHHVKYLLVGGMAGVVHGHVRTTLDMDLWIGNTRENTEAFVQALLENDVVGAELLKNMPLIFGWTSVRFGKSGFELDLGHSLKAFTETDFDSCYERGLDADYDGVPFRVIHLRDLITEKQATARPKDLGDVVELQRIWEEQNDINSGRP
ncbi:nucleotidyltransferase [Dyadobacter sp. CY261]|uniref:nucleotidyltransferase n=1 Tax=Dyadobacter sp. CY261 TaxID=2907203 RepID=UPI001F28ADF3|nr:nucleotidyltransferase [Dyadobacter sp. CY261]MCF0072510.1 nucleotidyltransferase [Dyadobacter sp. CY261]